MTDNLKDSMNLSNEYFYYGQKEIPDPINIKITNRAVNESNKLADRFILKDRIINQRESLGGFRIPTSELKKHINPSDEYQKKLELEIQKKKELLSQYQNPQNEPLYTYSSNNFPKTSPQIYNEKDIENMILDGNVPANENLIKMLEAQVKLLKAQTDIQRQKLDKENNKNSLSDSHVIEPKVSTHFFAANDNRIQAVKHVQTQQKPEYMTLEELQKEREEHEKHLLEVENEYYGRKIETEEEKELKRQMKLRAIQAKREMNMIHRPGYNNDEPLDDYDKHYVDKFGRFLERKSRLPDKIGYEEEWNTTKVKSQNANGIVNRNDGLPGYLDQDDYELYYYDINDKDNNLNFKRPLKSHPHTGRENTLKRTFRNEPGYENTMNKFISSSTGFQPWMKRMNNTMPNMGDGLGSVNVNNFNFTNTNNFNNTAAGNLNGENNNLNGSDNINSSINNINNNNNEPPFTFKEEEQKPDVIKINQSIQMKSNNMSLRQSNQLNQSSQHLSFIKMIFGMLNKNRDNEAPKISIPKDMNLDDDMVNELGFNDKNDFNNKLQNYPTKKPNLMNEEEFTNFLLNKGENFKNGNNEEEKNLIQNNTNNNFTNTMNNDIVNINNPNYNSTLKNKNFQSTNLNPKYYNSSPFPELFKDDEDVEQLPGLSTNTMDFLKNPSTKSRLRELKKSLKKSNSQNPKNLNKSLDMKKKINPDLQRNNSESHFNQTHNENNYPTSYSQNFPRKSDINFTIPQPFNFLKKNYHEKKLLKIQEILEDRQKKEDKVFKHQFHANPLNKKMFNKEGDLNNIIEREKIERKKRTDKLKEEIQKNMKPFDFYDEDERKYKERINQECIPPQFPQFKANPIRYKSQVNMYDGIIGDSREKREERIQKRALETLNNAKLPPRMEMHEKQKKLQEQEKKIYEAKKEEEEKKMRKFKSNEVPDFVKEQEEFLSKLDRMKKSRKPTEPKPFKFENPKKKANIYNFLDNENNPYVKNPLTKKEKKEKEEKRRLMIQKKPEIEPATTKALSLLMETRRKELEKKKKEEEKIKKEDIERIKRQNRLNERVRNSKAIVDNSKALKKKREEKEKTIQDRLNEDKNQYKNNLAIIKQRVANRPLLLESVGNTSLQRVIDDQTQNEINNAIEEAKIREEEKKELEAA